MKKQILFVLLMVCSMGAMAISLPSSSYNAYSNGSISANEGYTLGTGTSFVNSAVVGAYTSGTCVVDRQDPTFLELCAQCCQGAVLSNGGTAADYGACMTDCSGVSLPLDASVWMLLLLVSSYMVVALYRKKMHPQA